METKAEDSVLLEQLVPGGESQTVSVTVLEVCMRMSCDGLDGRALETAEFIVGDSSGRIVLTVSDPSGELRACISCQVLVKCEVFSFFF